MIHFFDSSALAKRYLAERGSDIVRSVLRRQHAAAARITHAEVLAAIARAHRERALTVGQRDALFDRFLEDFRDLTIVEIRQATLGAVREIVTRHPLRAYDAVQLACGLSLRRARMAVTLWSADAALCRAAEAEGLRSMHAG